MFWVANAVAQVPASIERADSQIALYRALLIGAQGDTEAELRALIDLSHALEDNDPHLGETLYWLGAELFGVGRIEEARDALTRGIGTGTCGRCGDLLEKVELDDKSVHELPVLISFDGAEHPVFHPARVKDLGSIEISQDLPDPGLLWTTTLRMGDPDRLVIGLRDPDPPPQKVALEVLSYEQDAVLEIVVEDVHGLQYALSPALEAPRGLPTRLEADLTTMLPLEAGEPLDPTQIVMLYIVDRTARRASGRNRLWIDDIEIR